MNIKRIIILVLGLIIAGFLLRSCFTGPEGQIRKQLSKLEELTSYESDEGNLSSLTKVKQLGGLFTEDVEIDLSGFGQSRRVQGRTQVQQAAMAARTQASSLEASLHDIHIELSEDKQSATVEATGRAKVSGESRSFVQEFVFTFEKTPEGWLIAAARNVEALR